MSIARRLYFNGLLSTCRQEAYTSYNSIVISYSACCSGYGDINCHGRKTQHSVAYSQLSTTVMYCWEITVILICRMWFLPNGYHVARCISWIRISFITLLITRLEKKKKKKNFKNATRYYRDSRSAKSREQA